MLKQDKNQNRREFLITSVRNTILSGLGIIGLGLGYKTLSSDPESRCEVNLPCRNCFKLGDCGEDEAVELRNDIKRKDKKTTNEGGVGNG